MYKKLIVKDLNWVNRSKERDFPLPSLKTLNKIYTFKISLRCIINLIGKIQYTRSPIHEDEYMRVNICVF